MSLIESRDGFLRMLRDELGMDLAEEDLFTGLDRLAVWDSMYLLRLITAMEEDSGRRIEVRRILEAGCLDEIRAWADTRGDRGAGGAR